jgi:glycosyltransferase involved in cell wall biosynthesis
VKVIFVGSFAGIKGGVGLACKVLLDNPHLTHISWIKVCSAMKSLPPPKLPVRMVYAARRIVIFLAALIRNPSKRVLIFSSAGGSFLEKGLMALVAHYSGHPVTFCPRSGYLLDDLQSSRFWRTFARNVFGRCQYVICQGESWKETFTPLVESPDKLAVLPNQMDCPDHLRLSACPKSPAEPVVFAMLGWIETNKGVFDLLDIVETHRNDLANCRFVLCGEGSRLNELRSRIAHSGLEHLISTPGWVQGPDKLKVLAQADVVLILSYREGLPNVLLEAMAAGKAILATRVGAIPDVVTDRDSALLTEPGAKDAIYQGMMALVHDRDLRKRLATCARTRFLANHDLAANGHRWIPVLSHPQGPS